MKFILQVDRCGSSVSIGAEADADALWYHPVIILVNNRFKLRAAAHASNVSMAEGAIDVGFFSYG